MSSLALTLAIGDYDRTGALKTGAVRPQGVDLNILTLSPEEIFYRMGRFLEFDACEFSLSTYTIRRGRGLRQGREPALPRLPDGRARVLRADPHLPDHAHGRAEGGAGAAVSVAAAEPLRRVHRGQAARLRAAPLHRGAAHVSSLAGRRGRGDARAHGRRPVRLRHRAQSQDRRDAGRLLFPAEPRAATAHHRGDVRPVDAG